MIGAIAGDIAGSIYEAGGMKRTDFDLFGPYCRITDDTVMTLAVADAILEGCRYGDAMRRWGARYPDAGYGGMFGRWLASATPRPYNSFGNGSAMRVSPVGFAFDSLEEVLEGAATSAAVSHNHTEGIKGAQAVAAAVFLARTGASREELRQTVEKLSGYDLQRSVEQIRPGYYFDVTCQGSVPEAIISFLDSEDVDSALRLAISLGGDADTQACIAGGIAQAFYREIPDHIRAGVKQHLPEDLALVLDRFNRRFGLPRL